MKEAMDAAQPPEFSVSGQYLNVCNKTYSNITQDDQELEFSVKQLAQLMYDLHQSYIKNLREEIGDDGMRELNNKIKSGELTKLPKLKKSKEKERKTIVLKKFMTPNKAPIKCQNCEEIMEVESATLEQPGSIKHYIFRCKKCLATKKINDKGMLVSYGRFEKHKDENSRT